MGREQQQARRPEARDETIEDRLRLDVDPVKVFEDQEERLLAESRQMLFDTINNATVEERGDWTVIKEKIRKDLKKFFYKQTAKRPFIVPVILEI